MRKAKRSIPVISRSLPEPSTNNYSILDPMYGSTSSMACSVPLYWAGDEEF